MTEATTGLTIKDLEGKDRTLAEIANQKPTLFIFVRHFG
jgi:hypothetical protein